MSDDEAWDVLEQHFRQLDVVNSEIDNMNDRLKKLEAIVDRLRMRLNE